MSWGNDPPKLDLNAAKVAQSGGAGMSWAEVIGSLVILNLLCWMLFG